MPIVAAYRSKSSLKVLHIRQPTQIFQSGPRARRADTFELEESVYFGLNIRPKRNALRDFVSHVFGPNGVASLQLVVVSCRTTTRTEGLPHRDRLIFYRGTGNGDIRSRWVEDDESEWRELLDEHCDALSACSAEEEV